MCTRGMIRALLLGVLVALAGQASGRDLGWLAITRVAFRDAPTDRIGSDRFGQPPHWYAFGAFDVQAMIDPADNLVVDTALGGEPDPARALYVDFSARVAGDGTPPPAGLVDAYVLASGAALSEMGYSDTALVKLTVLFPGWSVDFGWDTPRVPVRCVAPLTGPCAVWEIDAGPDARATLSKLWPDGRIAHYGVFIMPFQLTIEKL